VVLTMGFTIVAELALEAGLYDDAVRALRHVGMSREALGNLEETLKSYERAFLYLDKVSDPLLKARVQMSYAISAILLTSNHETMEVVSKEWSQELSKILAQARDCLSQAGNYYVKSDYKSANWALASIVLERMRIDDLVGDHMKAWDTFNKILAIKEIAQDPNLATSALLYAAAILKKAADKEIVSREFYFDQLNENHQACLEIPGFGGWKDGLFSVLLGDEFMVVRNLPEAIKAYQRAYDIQLSLLDDLVRPPRSDGIYGGFLAVDVCGKLQKALIALGNTDENKADKRLEAFTLVAESKARFFRRDLHYSMINIPSKLDLGERTRLAGMCKALSSGSSDPRIIKEDIDNFIDQEKDVVPELVSLFQPIVGEENTNILQDLDAAFSFDDVKTVLISLYATQNETIIYIVESPRETPKIFSIPITLEQLQNTLVTLNAGISGNARYPNPISPIEPTRKQRFFIDLFELKEKFSPLISLLKNKDLILVSPHGVWHNIPLDFFILPPLWEQGIFPGLIHIPSIKLKKLLSSRKETTKLSKAGVTTSFKENDSLDLFEQAHRTISTKFSEAEVDVISSFGDSSTVSRYLGTTQNVGIHHVLAHGYYEQNSDPMSSGILLADNQGLIPGDFSPNKNLKREVLLPGMTVQINGTTAKHITVQACSLGLSQSNLGDEFWGFSRALIAAGADSVISPLWDIDLNSSTYLLTQFYENWLVRNQPKWKAWSMAQYDLFMNKEHPEWSHFYHWAAFRLIEI